MITRLPLAPPFLTGVAILRRQPVLVFSLARLLGGEPTATSGGHVVVAIGRSRFVLAVDAIGGLQRLSMTDADQSPADAQPVRLDPAALLTPKWLALAAEMSGTAAAPTVVATDRQRFLCVTLGDRACAHSPGGGRAHPAAAPADPPARRCAAGHRRGDRIRRPDHPGHRRLAVAVASRRRRGRCLHRPAAGRGAPRSRGRCHPAHRHHRPRRHPADRRSRSPHRRPRQGRRPVAGDPVDRRTDGKGRRGMSTPANPSAPRRRVLVVDDFDLHAHGPAPHHRGRQRAHRGRRGAQRARGGGARPRPQARHHHHGCRDAGTRRAGRHEADPGRPAAEADHDHGERPYPARHRDDHQGAEPGRRRFRVEILVLRRRGSGPCRQRAEREAALLGAPAGACRAAAAGALGGVPRSDRAGARRTAPAAAVASRPRSTWSWSPRRPAARRSWPTSCAAQRRSGRPW